jgi:hypothetical protein
MVIAGDRSRSPKASDGAPAGASADVGGGTTDIAKHVADAFKSQEKSFRDSLAQGLEAPIQAMVADACQKQLVTMVTRLTALETGQTKILQDLESINKSLASLSHSQSVPSLGTAAPSPGIGHASVPDVTTPAFWRKPDPTILFCNTMGRIQVCRKKFNAAIVNLMAEANVAESEFELRGNPMDSNFEIKFISRSAAAQALQFYQSLQLGRGKWKTQQVPDAENRQVQFFVNPDKNAATIKKEVLCKALKDIIVPMLPEGKLMFVRKSTGSVMVDRKVMASVVIIDENNQRLAWYHPKRIELKVEQADVEEQFKVAAGGPSYS